jgi:hypothetical protein
VEGKRVLELRRLGKRIVLALESELLLVLHLMVAPGGKCVRRQSSGCRVVDSPRHPPRSERSIHE